MTTESNLVDGFCRFYSVLLYAYPAEFRRQYGGPMLQLFRDRCRDLARGPWQGGWAPPAQKPCSITNGNTVNTVLPESPVRMTVIRFAAQVLSDWLRTAWAERIAAVWSAGRGSTKNSSVTEWACAILVYLFVTTTMVQAYVIPTGSMEGNLLVGDHLLVDRVAYADPGPLGRHILPYREVERGDIVVFLYPEDTRRTYVKRVIGLAGDRIRLENGQVIRNGHRLWEPYAKHSASQPDAYRDNFPRSPEAFTTARGIDMFEHHVRNGEVIVPPGMLFAMGDNRDNSADSRYWGFVPRSHVVGKPLLVYWSYDAPTADLQEWTAGHVIDVAQHFFTKTRWKRTLLVPRAQRAVEDGGGP